MIFLRKQKGVTLLELILALSIGLLITVLSIKEYNAYKLEQSFTALQDTVDTLFQAMDGFYQWDCGWGDFVPSKAPVNFSGALTADLYSRGFLTGLSWNNALLDYSDNIGYEATGAYVLQYNLLPLGQVYTNACTSASDKPCSTFTQQALPIGQAASMVWVEQVAVKLKDTYAANIAAYQGRLNAQCVSDSLDGGFTVESCETPPSAPSSYLVWERLPLYSGSKATSSLWQSMPLLGQFNQQYTHDKFYELNSGYTSTQYYYNICGG